MELATFDLTSMRVISFQVCACRVPEHRFLHLGEHAVAYAELNRVLFCGIPVRENGIHRLPVVERPLVVADVRAKQENVAALLRTDASDTGNARFVGSLPLLQLRAGVAA